MQRVAPALGLAERIEDLVHADGLDFEDLGHEFAEPAFRETALLEPGEVFFGKVHDRDAGGWIGLDAELAEGHPGLSDLCKQVAEILTVDFGEVGFIGL